MGQAIRNFTLGLLTSTLLVPLTLTPASAQSQLPAPPVALSTAVATPPQRVALVIGDNNYASGALNTPVNDAGLIASTLQAAGFDVVGLPNLGVDATRTALRDFLTRAQAAGPQGTAFLYFAGQAVQYAGENYLVPVDAQLASDTAVPLETLRLSDYTRALAGIPLKARLIVVDGARANAFAKAGNGLASGLALVQPDPGELIAFNAAPGTIAPKSTGAYGVYANSLAQILRQPGLPPEAIFSTVRLDVNTKTKGGQIPWDASTLNQPFLFFQALANAPQPLISPKIIAARRAKPMREFSVNDAYQEAIERDSFDGYQQFLQAYPNSPLSRRVRAILASRREALTWQSVYHDDQPNAYWTYLQHYPHGIHAIDARRRLRYLNVALEPPQAFTAYAYDVPPPPEDELVYVDRPVVIFQDDGFDPPPPPHGFFDLPPRPDGFDRPAPRPLGIGFLPIPIPIPVPFARPIAPPPPRPNAALIPTRPAGTIVPAGTTVPAVAPAPARGGAGQLVPPVTPATGGATPPKSAPANTIPVVPILPPKAGAAPALTLPTPPVVLPLVKPVPLNAAPPKPTLVPAQSPLKATLPPPPPPSPTKPNLPPPKSVLPLPKPALAAPLTHLPPVTAPLVRQPPVVVTRPPPPRPAIVAPPKVAPIRAAAPPPPRVAPIRAAPPPPPRVAPIRAAAAPPPRVAPIRAAPPPPPRVAPPRVAPPRAAPPPPPPRAAPPPPSRPAPPPPPRPAPRAAPNCGHPGQPPCH